jgi:uncharacterized protein YqfA (UPF0365 family)
MFIPSFPSALAILEKGPFFVIFVAAAIIAFLVFFTILIKFFGIWLQARTAGAPVSLLNLVFMRFRKVPPALIVNSRITAVKAGLPFSTDQLEAHYLSGGDITHVVLAMIAADKAGISLSYDRACAIDLATKDTGKTVLEAVRTPSPKTVLPLTLAPESP